MSATLIPAAAGQEDSAGPRSFTVGGSKPLHRFLRGQPQITGIVVVIIGSCFFILSIAVTDIPDFHHNLPPGLWLGLLFIICGILYILTEHNPTKKTVTISLALSIVAIIASIWALLFLFITNRFLYDMHLHESPFDEEIEEEDNTTIPFSERTHDYLYPYLVLDMVYVVNIIAAVVIFIVMSTLARSALSSMKSQAIVVYNETQAGRLPETQPPVEQREDI